MKKENPEKSEIVLYQTEGQKTRIEVRLYGQTAWLSLNQMASLLARDKSVISKHIKNVFEEGELNAKAVVAKYATTAADGKTYQVEYFGLDMIISVGFRVKSKRGTQFRIWATQTLREYILKGFVLDDERLKNPTGPDYFEELLERIRDIRASEKRMYLRVREIFTLASDYQASANETQSFFQLIQNKLHFAATGKTAPELIAERVSHQKPNMGLTSWKGARVRKLDVGIAKNYRGEEEIAALNRIVVMFLDFAEDQARRRKQFFMKDWQIKLDEFLKFNDRLVLSSAGKVSHEEAEHLANEEYHLFEKGR